MWYVQSGLQDAVRTATSIRIESLQTELYFEDEVLLIEQEGANDPQTRQRIHDALEAQAL